MNKFSVLFLIFGFSFLVWASPAMAEKGAAIITSTDGESRVLGRASLEETLGGLKISAELSGLTPGKHGFHIHQFGACSDQGKAAGGHFNPGGHEHGLVLKDGVQNTHAGDLGNIEIAADGTGKLEAIVPGIGLSGSQFHVGGRALIVHEKEDDFGQPVGNAGGRIGCGIIQITGE